MKVMNGLVMTLEKDKRFLCVWPLNYVSSFTDSRMKVPRDGWCTIYRAPAQDIDQVLLHRIIFCSQCIQQQWSVSQKITSIRSKLPTAVCLSRGKKRGNCEANLLYVESDFGKTNHSQYSLPVEALNLVVESKSQPVELDNSTIEIHVPSRRKKSLNHIVLWILISNVALFDVTFDVTLRDDSSFGKLANSCS